MDACPSEGDEDIKNTIRELYVWLHINPRSAVFDGEDV
jgi:hypothetical protein